MNNLNIYKYFSEQPIDKKLLLVSFFITSPEAFAQLKKEWAMRNAEHGIVVGDLTSIQLVDPDTFGGSIVLADPYRLEDGFLTEVEVPFAFGMLYDEQDQSLYVASGTVIRQIKGGLCLRIMNNKLFNDLHTLTLSAYGKLLVVSTGTDSILEIELTDAEQVAWDWLATEQGYDTNPSGQKRLIDRQLNYQSIITSTPEHTTHINTALNDRPERILATLFHQGELIEIDRQSKKSKTVLSGLKSPHNIRKAKNGFILSDSRANRVLFLNNDLQIKGEIKGDFDWIQDACELDDRLGHYLLGDSNNDRIVLVDRSGTVASSLQWVKDSRKISGMEIVTVSQAREIFLT